MHLQIRAMLPNDWSEVLRIYSLGLKTGYSTFETRDPSWDSWNASHLDRCRLVVVDNSSVLGWAALSPVSGRCVYGGVAEVSIYLDPIVEGRGVGFQLFSKLIDESEKEGFWTLQSSIFRNNERSIKLHERAGFRYVGYRERIGKLQGQWLDTLLYERRSKIIESDIF
jgi:L-amino acid N-acyltransferase YncA